MLKRVLVGCILGVMAGGLLGMARAEVAPRRIAVVPLQTAVGITRFWQGDFDPAAAMTTLMTNALAKSRYAVFDAQKLDRIAREQNLGGAGPLTPEAAIHVGQLTGVEYVVTGTVVEFSAVNKPGGKGIHIPRAPVTLGGGGKRVTVAVEIRVANVKTGRISATIRGQGEDVVSDFSFGGYVRGTDAGGAYSSKEFLNSGLGRAMSEASDEALSEIDTAPFSMYNVEATVVDVDGINITLNVGHKQGVLRGMRFNVTRPGTSFDPTTNQPRFTPTPVGDVEVIAVDEEVCTCRAVGGAGPFQVKDRAVRRK